MRGETDITPHMREDIDTTHICEVMKTHICEET